MRHTTIPLFALALSLRLSALFAAEVTIYPYTSQNVSGKPLVIAEYVTGETTIFKPRKWTFAGATYETRTVWNIPVETNTILEAWIDMNGDGMFDVEEPYGTNASRSYPEIELSDRDAVSPRIDLVNDKSNIGLTADDVIDEIRRSNRMPDYAKTWVQKNGMEFVKVTDRPTRVRVVRWTIGSFEGSYNVHSFTNVRPRIVFDRIINPSLRRCLTEADILSYGGMFDIENDEMRAVVTDQQVDVFVGTVMNANYNVVIGDDSFAWADANSTNTVKMLKSVIRRNFYDTWSWVDETSMRSSFRFGRAHLSWKDPDESSFTAYRIIVTNESSHASYDSGPFKRPARDLKGLMTWMFETPLDSGSYKWKISGYDSKYYDLNEHRSFNNSWVPFVVP